MCPIRLVMNQLRGAFVDVEHILEIVYSLHDLLGLADCILHLV